MKNIFFNKTLLLLVAIILTAYADIQAQTFPNAGNLTSSRLRVQGNLDKENGWQRGLISQNIQYRLSDNKWVVGGKPYDDFSMMKFNNGGSISFYVRSRTQNNYTLTNAQLEKYKRMTILPNGNVGIGIGNPANKLEVNGTIRAKEVKVEIDNWGDYVFYDDYQLPTLTEEKAHIEAKGHLLGFESAKDMAGELQVGDVAKRQQVKIEEMMLHLIDMGETLKSVEAKVSTLETENAELKRQLEERK